MRFALLLLLPAAAAALRGVAPGPARLRRAQRPELALAPRRARPPRLLYPVEELPLRRENAELRAENQRLRSENESLRAQADNALAEILNTECLARVARKTFLRNIAAVNLFIIVTFGPIEHTDSARILAHPHALHAPPIGLDRVQHSQLSARIVCASGRRCARRGASGRLCIASPSATRCRSTSSCCDPPC